MTPNRAASVEAVPVDIEGDRFYVRLVANLDTGETTTNDEFSAALMLQDSERTDSLLDVARVDAQRVSGAVPAGLPVGLYDLVVTGPYGDSNVLAGAFEVCDLTEVSCPATGTCVDPDEDDVCVEGDRCWAVADAGNADTDGDCPPPPYESDPACGDACDTCTDADGDGWGRAGLDTSGCPNGEDCDDDCDVCWPGHPEICADGEDNDCNGLSDGEDPACGGANTPPVPAILVTPASGLESDVYTADATGTRDREEAASALVYEWDWEGDGTYEATGPIVQKDDYLAGEHLVVLRVTDTGGLGLSAYATFPVLVVQPPASYVLIVTTDQDHDDAETYPGPYNLGLSLREAIALANGQLSGALVTIRFQDAYTISLTSALPSSTDPTGLWIVGDGVTIDGTAVASGACFTMTTDNTRIFGLRIIDCPIGGVLFNGGAGNQVSRCTIERSGEPLAGSAAVKLNAPGTVGPGNVIAESPGNAIYLPAGADGSQLVANWIHGSAQLGIRTTVATALTIRQNVIYGNGYGGIGLLNNCDACTLTHNTIHGNTGDGVSISSNSSAVDFRNNILSNNTDAGLDCLTANFDGGFNDYNDYWGNTADDCTCCGASLPANSLTEDPVYVDLALDGYLFRLMPTSPLIDAGVDTGADVNGPEPGNYNGAYPDIGAWESPGP